MFETPANFFLQPKDLNRRVDAGVDTNICFIWDTNFVQETAFLKRNNRKMLLITYEYACFVSFRKQSFEG